MMTVQRPSEDEPMSEPGEKQSAKAVEKHASPAVSRVKTELNEELKNENTQLRAQLLEQQEIMSKEFRRRMRYLSLGESEDTYDGSDAQKEALKLLTSASVNQHDKITLYRSRYEKAQEEIEALKSEMLKSKKYREDNESELLMLEKEIDTNCTEIEGLRRELCHSLDKKQELEEELRVERKKNEELLEEIEASRTKLEKLNLTTSGYEEQIASLSNSLASKDRVIQSQREEILQQVQKMSIMELIRKTESCGSNQESSVSVNTFESETNADTASVMQVSADAKHSSEDSIHSVYTSDSVHARIIEGIDPLHLKGSLEWRLQNLPGTMSPIVSVDDTKSTYTGTSEDDTANESIQKSVQNQDLVHSPNGAQESISHLREQVETIKKVSKETSRVNEVRIEALLREKNHYVAQVVALKEDLKSAEQQMTLLEQEMSI